MFSDQLFSDFFQNHSSSGTAICVGCLSIKCLVLIVIIKPGTPTVLDDLPEKNPGSPPL
jgi:hypothetical protein